MYNTGSIIICVFALKMNVSSAKLQMACFLDKRKGFLLKPVWMCALQRTPPLALRSNNNWTLKFKHPSQRKARWLSVLK